MSFLFLNQVRFNEELYLYLSGCYGLHDLEYAKTQIILITINAFIVNVFKKFQMNLETSLHTLLCYLLSRSFGGKNNSDVTQEQYIILHC